MRLPFFIFLQINFNPFRVVPFGLETFLPLSVTVLEVDKRLELAYYGRSVTMIFVFKKQKTVTGLD